MGTETALSLLQQSMWVAAQIAAPAILAGLAVGTVVSVFQAATQIQEQSLVFVPKVAALLGALSVCGAWMLTRIVDFTRDIILSLPQYAP
jgi:flagellar biosynthetic protein FliQ